MNEEPWYSSMDHEFSSYRARDSVVATVDFIDIGGRRITKGKVDVIESVSSDHHGGLQLNLVSHGRGWSNHVWRKNPEASAVLQKKKKKKKNKKK
jgi:hypothetical protein